VIAKRLRGKKSGASLTEMIVAIVVLGVVLMGIMAGVTISQGNMMTRERQNAVDLGLTLLEDCEARPFNELAARVAEINSDSDDGFYGIFNVEISTNLPNPFPATIPLDLVSADITLEITWGSTIGGSKTVKLNREVSVSASQNSGEISK
jgi:Tfp pilus assembly protein PilV